MMKSLVTLAIKGNTKAATIVMGHLARFYGVEEERAEDAPLDADEQEIVAAFLERYPPRGDKS